MFEAQSVVCAKAWWFAPVCDVAARGCHSSLEPTPTRKHITTPPRDTIESQ